jgi:hypothetical protein
MTITPLNTRRVLLLAATLLAGVALAACGSTSKHSNASASSGASASAARGGTTAAKLVACLKSHGVALPAGAGQFRRFGATGASGPRGFRGGGLFGGGRRFGATGRAGAGLASNPKLAAAFRACGGGNFAGRFSPAQIAKLRSQRDAAIKSFASCVARHGYTITPNISGTGPVLSPSLQTNKKFLAAAKPCESLLANIGRGGFGGGPPGGGFGGPPPGGGPAPA